MSQKMVVALVGKYPVGTEDEILSQLQSSYVEIRPITTHDQYKALTDADCIILRNFHALEEDMNRNQNLKMICRWGTGFDTVDIEAAGKRGIVVCNTPGANAYAVSEHTIMLMLAVYHNLLRHTFSIRDGRWSKTDYIQQSFTLKNKIVGLIGGGNIGRQVAKRLKAFGALVQYYDVFRLSEQMERDYCMKFVTLEELLMTSDIISLHIPLLDSNYHMIGKKEIDLMKPNSVLINTARGGLVDEDALVQAIAETKLAGAGLDCVENEPLNKDSDLFKFHNIIVTPHVAGTSVDIGETIIPMIVSNIKNLLNHKPAIYVVNKEYLKSS